MPINESGSAPTGDTGGDAAGVRALDHAREAPGCAPRARTGDAPGLDFLIEWGKILLVSVVLFGLIRTFLVEAFKIPSGSMEGTLQVGDFLLVNKLVYGAEVPFTHKRLPRLREPQRGDVIVFEYPEDPTKNFVKRLIGVPGDTVQMRDAVLDSKRRRRGGEVRRAHGAGHGPGARGLSVAARLCAANGPHGQRDIIRRETTGGRWSSQKGTTSSWATIGTTRSTADTGDLSPTHWSKAVRS